MSEQGKLSLTREMSGRAGHIRLGRHMPTGSKMVKAAEIAHQLGCETIQIFASNPTGWRPSAYDPKEDAAFAQAAQHLDLHPVVLHAPYLINLAASDETNWEKSCTLLAWTLRRAASLGASYVICHMGSHRGFGVEAGIARLVQGAMRVLLDTSPLVMLLLENGVGAGNSLGHDFAHLAAVLTYLPEDYQERVGICLDTAHLWGAGYDLSTMASTLQVLHHFDETVGLARLRVLHINDTKVALNSHRDVHARLGEGIIGDEGLHTLLTDPRLSHVAALLETPIKLNEQGKEDWEDDKQHFARFKALAEA
jgi:deoxyribonuclease-4